MSAESYILQELHLYNWGAFAGRHQVGIDAGNSAIIGPTGSGKTTLVDALMTLLCANPRYNLASTGGHESDRDLVSYVRGASGQGNDSGDHIARPGRCATGVAARLVRGSESVWLGALLWFDGSSQSAGDMQKRWLLAQGAGHSLDLWLEEQHSGGARALTRLAKDSEGLQMFSSKAPYLAKLHSFFEVGANAFTLLNRAAGLKQLNSIDDIFRELVLDDHSAFDDAQKVVDGFGELASIHADLELANAQFVSLLPLRDLATREQQQSQQLAHLQALQQQLPRWFAAQGVQWWSQRVAQLQAQINQRSQDLQAAQHHVEAARKHEQDLHGIYLQAGGADVATLEENIVLARKELDRKRDNLAQYQTLARNLGLAAQASASDLTTHQAQAATAVLQLDTDQTELQAQAETAITDERNAHQRKTDLEAEYEAVRQRPGSNLPVDFQRFRADLAAHLDMPEDALPFVAELVEVQKTQHAWRGAIERALGAHRLRVLVSPDVMPDALDWVNQRHNRLHVRLLEAHAHAPAQPASFMADGFARKLNLKPHAHQNTLRQLLADHGQEVEAWPHYLQRLQTLEEEALPQKRQRFQEYLNETSQQGVDTLLNGIAAQVADIEERIAQLNRTLQRVDFQPGRYLQLEPRAVIHQSLQDLTKAQAQLRTERLRDDGGHSHYRALRAIVDMLQTHAGNRRSKAAQALLDARYRLQFAVLVMDRASGQMLERRTGSQGGSGGEKEIIASYVLTASLSYALCPDGASRPVFGTIVLDEAFSKSSQAVAARIIQALREFGLHALFVTPNKEVRLLRNHTRSAVVVHRRGAQATLASLRWEEIDAFRQSITPA